MDDLHFAKHSIRPETVLIEEALTADRGFARRATTSSASSCSRSCFEQTRSRATRATRSVVAIADTMAASAAYYIASAAEHVVITPSGSVGSIGVIAAHEDISQLQGKLGVKTTLVTAGEHKGELGRFGPLTAEARAEIQRRALLLYAADTRFAGHSVERGRPTGSCGH